MRRSCTFLFGLMTLMPLLCHAESKCPWISEATAGGVLAGTVSLTARITDRGDGVCEFSRNDGAAIHRLRVSVEIMTDIAKQFSTYLAQCGPQSTPLRAVGNEAVMCSSDGKVDQYAEQVVGRVRDQAFVVSVSTSIQQDPSMTQKMRRQKANLVAEQVAGILF